MKKVKAIQDIVFEGKEISLIPEGTVYTIGGVVGSAIILQSADGEDYLIDGETFEAGFAIAET